MASAQTFQDFELVLVDDGSTDETAALVDRAARDDARAVVIHHANQGLTRSLNVGLRAAHGDYVARQDADDVSLPCRLEQQVSFLNSHPEHLVVGCRYLKIDADGRVLGGANTPRTDLGIKLRMLDANAIAHSGATFRRREVLEAGGATTRTTRWHKTTSSGVGSRSGASWRTYPWSPSTAGATAMRSTPHTPTFSFGCATISDAATATCCWRTRRADSQGGY